MVKANTLIIWGNFSSNYRMNSFENEPVWWLRNECTICWVNDLANELSVPYPNEILKWTICQTIFQMT